MNIANKLTLARIALLPFLILLMYLNNFYTRIFALIIFLLAALTDFYDGKLARKYNVVTTLGIFLDPLADKLIISAAFISFVGLKELSIPAWMVIIITSREFIITGLRSMAAVNNKVIPADQTGKIKTTFQIVSIITLMLVLIVNSAIWRYLRIKPSDLIVSTGWYYTLGWILKELPYCLMLCTTLLTLYSGLSYLYKHRVVFQEDKKP